MTTNNSHPSAWQAFLDEVFPDKKDQETCRRLFAVGLTHQKVSFQDRLE